VFAIAVAALLARSTYAHMGWVFLLSGVDLGVHELGHLLTMFWLPRPFVAAAGSIAQVAVPLVLAVYFWRRRADAFGTALMLAWAAESLNSVSVYAGDAAARALPLLGGNSVGHDWAYLLGPQVFDVLESTSTVEWALRAGSAALFVAAFAIPATQLARPRLAAWSAARHAAALAERRERLTVRESRGIRLERPDPSATTEPVRRATP